MRKRAKNRVKRGLFIGQTEIKDKICRCATLNFDVCTQSPYTKCNKDASHTILDAGPFCYVFLDFADCLAVACAQQVVLDALSASSYLAGLFLSSPSKIIFIFIKYYDLKYENQLSKRINSNFYKILYL